MQNLRKIWTQNLVMAATLREVCWLLLGHQRILYVIAYDIQPWKDSCTFLLSIAGRALLVYLTVADLLTAIGNLTGIMWYIFNDKLTDRISKIMCDMHASITFFSSISSFLWTVIIGVHLHLCLVQNKARFARKLTGMFHTLGWIVPGNVTTILLHSHCRP